LRECTDYFLDKVRNSDVDVHFYSEQLQPYLRIQIHKNALECFIRFCFLAYAIRVHKCQGNYLPELTLGSMGVVIEACRFLMVDMRANNLRRAMKAHWEKNKRSQPHPYWAQRKLLITSVDKSYEIFNNYKAWCIKESEQPLTRTQLVRELMHRLPIVKDKNKKGNISTGRGLYEDI
jgi:hypothetical protein